MFAGLTALTRGFVPIEHLFGQVIHRVLYPQGCPQAHWQASDQGFCGRSADPASPFDHVVHRLSTGCGQGYPQAIHRVIHTLSRPPQHTPRGTP